MRLLVVEDERNVANALEGGLVAEGFRVDVAADGDTAYWMATEHDYSLIILDIMLPGRNGYQVCRDLRADGDDAEAAAALGRAELRLRVAAGESASH